MINKPKHLYILLFSFLILIFSLNSLKTSLPQSPFIIAGTQEGKVCSELGCLKISDNNGVDFHRGTLSIRAVIGGIENLYELKERIPKLEAVMKAEGVAPCSVRVLPDYAKFTNETEALREINVSIEAPLACFKGEGKYSLKVTYDKHEAGQIDYRIINNSPPYSNLVPRGLLFIYEYINTFVFVISFLFMTISYLVETRHYGKNAPQFKFFMFVRVIVLFFMVLLGILDMGPDIPHIFLVCIIFSALLPWGMLPQVRNRLTAEEANNFFKKISSVSAETNPGPGEKEKKEREEEKKSIRGKQHDANPINAASAGNRWQEWTKDSSPFWVGISVVTLAVFVYSLFSNSSFLWGIFEERDFLRALNIDVFKHFPVLGPELLQGGQTPGGFLYLFLAPFAKIRQDPMAFAILNKVLFILSAVGIWVILNKYVSRIAATFGLVLFCSSLVIAEFAYWPIHPSMSIAFFLLFVFLALRGFLDGSRSSIIMSGLLLSILVQLHFSYYLALLAFSVLLIKRRSSFDIRTILLCILLFIVPLIPYLVSEVMHGFPNTRLIFERPRLQSAYVDVWLLGESPMAIDLYTWIKSYDVGGVISNFFRLLIFLASCASIYLVLLGVIPSDDKKRSFLEIVLVLFMLPGLVIFFLNMGYKPRHMISYAPLIFLLMGTGIDYLVKIRGSFLITVCAIFVVLSLVFMAPVANNTASWAYGQSEWAVNYSYRNHILDSLISQMGITGEKYETNVYWWFISYAADPFVYKRLLKEANVKKPEQPKILEMDKPDSYIIIFRPVNSYDQLFYAPVFDQFFEMTPIAKINGVQAVWKAKLKKFKGAYPVGNSVSHTQLGPFEQLLEFTPLNEDGVFNVRFKGMQEKNDDWYSLLSLQKGRIKVLMHFKENYIADKTVIQWEMVSASLNGYYQEIKTIWKPYLILRDASAGEEHLAWLLDDVVGSLIYKTPLRGTIEVPGPERNWEMSLGVKGWFDQSSMTEPMLQDTQWKLSDSRKHVLLNLECRN